MLLLLLIFSQANCATYNNRTDAMRKLLRLVQEHQSFLPDPSELLMMSYLQANDDVNQQFLKFLKPTENISDLSASEIAKIHR